MSNSVRSSGSRVLLAVGVMLVAYGSYKLVQRLFAPWWAWVPGLLSMFARIVWPLAIIAVGVFVVVEVKRGVIAIPSGRPLYRSVDDRVLGGVCGGLASYFAIDSVVVRAVAVVLLLAATLVMAGVYLVAWVTVPKAPS